MKHNPYALGVSLAAAAALLACKRDRVVVVDDSVEPPPPTPPAPTPRKPIWSELHEKTPTDEARLRRAAQKRARKAARLAALSTNQVKTDVR